MTYSFSFLFTVLSQGEMDSASYSNKIFLTKIVCHTCMNSKKGCFVFIVQVYISIWSRREPFHPVLVECCTCFPSSLLHADKPFAANIGCSPYDKAWGVLCPLHCTLCLLLCPPTPTPLPRLGSPAVFISFSLSLFCLLSTPQLQQLQLLNALFAQQHCINATLLDNHWPYSRMQHLSDSNAINKIIFHWSQTT